MSVKLNSLTLSSLIKEIILVSLLLAILLPALSRAFR